MIRSFILFLFLLAGIAGSASDPADKKPISTAVVIFGGTGDLTAKKLLPSLYVLAHEGSIPEDAMIIGVGRRDLTAEAYRKQMEEGIRSSRLWDEAFWDRFKQRIVYHQADFSEDAGYIRLKKLLDDLGQSNRLYYLATQPSSFSPIVEKLDANGLIYPENESKWSRVAIEKPFGRDLASAMELQQRLSEHLKEEQILRVDHFLGKEGMQNLLNFRFDKGDFEELWDRNHIEQVQITLSEEIGIGSRAQFWEETGLVRDLMQNHLMQILAYAAMEKPQSLNSDAIRAAKNQLLQSIRLFPLKQMDQLAIRGQYGSGKIEGKEVTSYRQEKGISSDSSVETFAAAKLFIDNDRWRGVPFYVRAGKRLPEKTTEIAVLFKGGHTLFIRIQPEPGIFLQKAPKNPEEPSDLIRIRLDASTKHPPSEAYEKIFLACLQGDLGQFVQAEEQIYSWRLWTSVIDHWKKNPPPSFPNYEAGTWGPQAASDLTQWKTLGNPSKS